MLCHPVSIFGPFPWSWCCLHACWRTRLTASKQCSEFLPLWQLYVWPKAFSCIFSVNEWTYGGTTTIPLDIFCAVLVFDAVDLLVVSLPCCSSALLLFLSVALLPLFYGLFLRSVIILLLLSSNVRTSSSLFITKRMICLKRQVLIVISVCVAFPFL